MDLNQTVLVGDGDMEIRAYYAGHVLGAAMFYLRVGDESVVYTGTNKSHEHAIFPAVRLADSGMAVMAPSLGRLDGRRRLQHDAGSTPGRCTH